MSTKRNRIRQRGRKKQFKAQGLYPKRPKPQAPPMNWANQNFMPNMPRNGLAQAAMALFTRNKVG